MDSCIFKMSVYARWLMFEISVVVVILCSLYGDCTNFRSTFDISEGEKQYEIIRQHTSHPIYGECWRNAIQKLHTNCEHMTAAVQSRMALQFFNCFLETTGSETYSCADDIHIKDCFNQMTDRDFTSYTTFFANTQNMCFFLRNEHWREETENTINRLVDASTHIGSQLNDQFEVQKMMLQSQKESLRNEQKMLEHGKEVNEALAVSKSAAVELFHHLINFRATVFGEIAGLYTLLFYFFSLAISYLITTTRRTKSSRFWVFTIFSVTFIAEKMLINWNAMNISSNNESHSKDVFSDAIWILRRFSIILAGIVIIICSATYRDLNKINNQLLLETRLLLKDLSERTAFLKGQGEDLDVAVASIADENGKVDIKPNNRPSEANLIQKYNRSPSRNSPSRRYNLRDRSKMSSPDSSGLLESPLAFEDLVHYMANASRRKSLKLRKTLMNQ